MLRFSKEKVGKSLRGSAGLTQKRGCFLKRI
jgi:hypothetical protein